MAEVKKETPAKVEKKEIKNLKQKLQEARMLLKERPIKRTGSGGMSKNGYFTLGDVEPHIIEVSNQVGITPVFTFDKELATLTLYDWDSDETIKFTSVMVDGSDSKMAQVQFVGSQMTYQKRNLYFCAYSISEENDEKVDSTGWHDILVIKQRLETTMTDLMKKGYKVDDIIKKIGLKDEKQYMSYLNACTTINTIESNMRVLLNEKRQ